MGGKVRTLITLNNPGDAKDGKKCFNHRPGCYWPQGIRSWICGGLTHDAQKILCFWSRRRQRSNTVNDYVLRYWVNGTGLITWFGLPVIWHVWRVRTYSDTSFFSRSQKKHRKTRSYVFLTPRCPDWSLDSCKTKLQNLAGTTIWKIGFPIRTSLQGIHFLTSTPLSRE